VEWHSIENYGDRRGPRRGNRAGVLTSPIAKAVTGHRTPNRRLMRTETSDSLCHLVRSPTSAGPLSEDLKRKPDTPNDLALVHEVDLWTLYVEI
jgi:hypothetical protein